MAGKPGRSGPKTGNLNAVKTGTKVALVRLTVGELPKPLLSVKREGRAYRRALERAVLDAKGEINLTDAHLIDTATAATIAAGISRWVLRNKMDGMKGSDIHNCGQAIVKSKQLRDQAVKQLDLDRPPPAPWAIDVPSEELADA